MPSRKTLLHPVTTVTVADDPNADYERVVQGLLEAAGPVLVRGGAGSGKTTVALRKAAAAADEGLRFPHSKVLFLSFANATLDRVSEHALRTVSQPARRAIELSTYHSFAWSVIRSHGYLLGAPRYVSILGIGEENAFRSQLPGGADVDAEFRRLFIDRGRVAFDYFAGFANEVLRNHPDILRAFADAYPLIFLDEFQDTTDSQWALMKTIGTEVQLVALGDPDQRIYAFAGASPERFEHFSAEFNPLQIDLSKWNWRSPEGSIVQFGKDILAGRLKDSYPSVGFVPLEYNPLFQLKSEVLKAIRRLRDDPSDRSIAIITPSNNLSAAVYDYFREETPLPALRLDIHAAKDEAFAAAIFVAAVLGTSDSSDAAIAALSRALANYVRTKSRQLSRSAVTEINKLEREATRLDSGAAGRELKSSQQLREAARASLQRARTGHPFADYLTTVSVISAADLKLLTEIARNTRLLGILKRGSQIEAHLAREWRDSGTYEGAAKHMNDAIIAYQVLNSKAVNGDLVVMNIHRAKGKEFQEVFVYEERYRPFVRDDESDLSDARYAMNVAVTRARKHVTVLTPRTRPCRLFLEQPET